MMRSRMLYILLIGMISAFFGPHAVMAGAPATWRGQIKGVPVWITVVPRGHEISAQTREREPWWKWGNATTDAYLFAFIAQDDVRLILEFQQQSDGTPEARIYLNRMGHERLDYALQGDELQIHTNNGYPYLTIRPEQGGWYIQDRVNYKLNISIDGPLAGGGDSQAATDGIVDWASQVGSEQLGIPAWQTTRLVHDPHPTWGYSRLGAFQRMADAPPFKVAPPIMPAFPYFDIGLGVKDPDSPYVGVGGGDIDWYRENPSPLYFNMRFAEFQLFAFPGFQNGGMYYSNSLTLPPDVDFESPFAFYSFDPTVRYPQLAVRGEYFPADDPYVPDTKSARSSFRYSWKRASDAYWNYSLQLGGTYRYTQQVTIGDVQFLGVPASELPGWVMSKQWPLATFIEAVDGYPSSEGIYFYTTQTHENWPWADGASDRPPEYFAEPYLQKGIRLSKYSARSLPIGFRGEYSAAYFRQPMTYMSQIDNRLHLLYAQGGVWNLGDGQVLRMHNLSGGAYIDGWTREQVPPDEDEAGSPRAAPGTIEEALYALDGFLIYSGPQGSELRRAEYSLSRFELHPPTDKATWLAFREQMAPYRGQERDPADLKRWLADFAGTPLIATKGKISDVRATDRGFRFVIDLQPGFQILGFGGLQGLKPGAYVMTYDGKWQMAPLTPPALSAALIGTTLTQLQPGVLQVALRNDGRQDLPQAMLELQAAPPGGSATVVATQTVALLAQSPITATFQWVAPTAGQWTLTPAIRLPDGVRSAFAPAQITVLPAPDATPAGIVAASIAPGSRPLIVLALVMFATIAALVFWRQSIVFPAEKSR